MTIQAQAALLKATIRKAAEEALKEFTKETGLSPSRIVINMIEVTTHSDMCDVYVPGSVSVEITL